ncbi:hypothetical protein J5J86_03010 [Aquabacter sp. L1I39]|uniref:hypothetical protein n=1 Tax=Aquabacter sp. L1I39 TaxID=2820278 RepID=UPI001ADB1728|nr:hypothetical protein [Aquabacter sp. L1I39]QTL04331.1 hypothetical protein J5J86_03010 [Aquabacter sp. L1I39]
MHALSRHLPHFGPLGPTLSARPASPAEKPAASPPAVRPPAIPERPRPDVRFSQDDLARAVELARTEARREAQEQAQAAIAALEAARAQDQSAAESRIAAVRADWTAEQADRLADGFRSALDGFGTQLSDALAPILAPFVTERVRDQALRELDSLVKHQMALGSGAIQITGPQDLLDALGTRLGAASGITFTPGNTPEVRIEADGAVIETQLQAWRDRLAGLSD